MSAHLALVDRKCNCVCAIRHAYGGGALRLKFPRRLYKRSLAFFQTPHRVLRRMAGLLFLMLFLFRFSRRWRALAKSTAWAGLSFNYSSSSSRTCACACTWKSENGTRNQNEDRDKGPANGVRCHLRRPSPCFAARRRVAATPRSTPAPNQPSIQASTGGGSFRAFHSA